jgi:hypothetical protein
MVIRYVLIAHSDAPKVKIASLVFQMSQFIFEIIANDLSGAYLF